MNRILVVLALSLFAMSASAVDVTMTLTPPQIARAQAALGKAKNLKTPDTPAVLDANGNVITPMVPGVPRIATGAELKQFVVDTLRTLVIQQEQAAAQAAAVAAVSAPAAFEPQ
jgi:hypothetical protein